MITPKVVVISAFNIPNTQRHSVTFREACVVIEAFAVRLSATNQHDDERFNLICPAIFAILADSSIIPPPTLSLFRPRTSLE
jgi:hypothetical protein